MTDVYIVQKLENNKDIIVNVPGSKSITNRALMLAALSDGECNLDGVLFSDDSRAFLDCLEKLGFQLFIDENEKRVKVVGTSGKIPNRKATIDVRSAGTAARFLTVMLAVTGGEYTLNSSEQMKKRPMGEIIDLLRNAGVKISCLEEEGHFPFIISSNGLDKKEVSINTDTSSQYASALLMAAVMTGLKIKLTGKRVNGAYIKITLNMLKQFGIKYIQAEENKYNIEKQSFRLEKYQIEPDMSGACYFYAMSLMLKKKVLVKNLHLNSMQGDIKFLYALKKMGCLVKDTDEGIIIDGSNVSEYKGIEIDMNDFSD
ncbi:MAG: 3-phosphoshikimate 1-carboxyvinyltransferase, partial [Eubacterium sp.]|nr:3-phosphoshikimate 1-carboxyvinyltransferase [Eubacterium sp.]